ncbi:MAG: hypothetical protein AB1765_03445 [Candidatus Hydrogenedentota bacterium]
MKKLFVLFSIFVLILSINTFIFAQASTSVSIPWQEFKKLLDEIQKLKSPDIKPLSPVPYIISESNYKLRAENDILKGNLNLRIYVLNDIWVEIPLLDQNLSIEDAKINGQNLLLYKKEGRYYSLIRGTGNFDISLKFSCKITVTSATNTISFAAPQTPVTLLELTIPGKNARVTSTPEPVATTKSLDNATVYTAYFPSTEHIGLEWVSAVREIEATKKEPRIFITTSSLLTVGEGHIRNRLFINLEVLQSGIDTLKISLPQGMNLLSLTPDENIEWEIQDIEGSQIVLIKTAYPMLGNKTFILDADFQMPDVSSFVKLTATAIEPSHRTTGYIAISALTNVEVVPKEVNNLVHIDQTELPQDLIQATDKPILLSFKYVTLPYDIGIEITRHKDIAVLTTAADRAEILTLNTGEQEITRCIFQIRNNLRQYLEFELPADAVLWSTFTDNQPVKPGLGSKPNSILVPLLKSRPGEGEEALFPVEILFYRDKKGASCLGSLHQILPGVDVPISTIQWEIYFPFEWKVIGITGDFRKAKAVITPLAQEREKKSYKLESQAIQSNIALYQQQMQLKPGLSAGMLPVRVDIPRVGQYKVFSKNYYNPDKGKSPGYRIFYVTPFTIKIFRLLSVIAGFISVMILERYVSKKLKIIEPGEPLSFWRRLKPTSKEFLYCITAIIVISIFHHFISPIWGAVLRGILFGIIIGLPYQYLKNTRNQVSGTGSILDEGSGSFSSKNH